MNDLSQLLSVLPRHAEEGGLTDTISRAGLISTLTIQGSDNTTAQATVALIERLYVSLHLLDDGMLAQGQWRFVSYPAYLLGRSLLTGLADEQQAWLPAYFWHDDQPEPVKAQQRQFLHQLESHRVRYHADNTAPPIRHVAVAWGLLKLDGHFLLHHREDKHRPDVANYVPIGGRLHPGDLPVNGNAALTWLENADEQTLHTALERTLYREVEEETGLLPAEDYSASDWQNLPPFRQVEGAGSRHAYSDYRIHVWSLQLTRRGLFKLLRHIEQEPRFAWFTAAELANGQSRDGKTAYLDALRRDYANAEALANPLTALPDSFVNEYPDDLQALGEVDIPVSADEPLRHGKTGQEQEYVLSLTDDERASLLALAWWGLGLPLHDCPESIRAYPYGWLEADEPMAAALRHLAAALREQKFPLLEVADECRFRLALPKERIYFAASLFHLSILTANQQETLQLTTQTRTTPLGVLPAQCVTVPLPQQLAHAFKQAVDGQLSQFDNEHLPRRMRREIEPQTRTLGLRKLLRVERNIYQISVPWVPPDARSK